MKKIPDIVILIGQKTLKTVIKECLKLNISTITIVQISNLYHI